MTAVAHASLLTGRNLRTLWRQPFYLAFTLVQPMIWLLLFGQLFSGIAQMPGFPAGSYLEYLTPGVVVMTAMMAAGWAGTTFITDMERGVMDRDLASPVGGGSIVAASLAYQACTTVLQSLIVVGVGLAAGARFAGGVTGAAVAVAAAVLLGLVFAALSNAFALLLRSQDALIGLSQFITLPLTFLSSVMLSPDLMPSWVAAVARYNPVDWAATAAREALAAAPAWGVVLPRLGLLAGLAMLMAYGATWAFRAYQRSA